MPIGGRAVTVAGAWRHAYSGNAMQHLGWARRSGNAPRAWVPGGLARLAAGCDCPRTIVTLFS